MGKYSGDFFGPHYPNLKRCSEKFNFRLFTWQEIYQTIDNLDNSKSQVTSFKIVCWIKCSFDFITKNCFHSEKQLSQWKTVKELSQCVKMRSEMSDIIFTSTPRTILGLNFSFFMLTQFSRQKSKMFLRFYNWQTIPVQYEPKRKVFDWIQTST